MQGRTEKELKMKEKIENKIKSRPRYMKDFYKMLFSKSYTTQNTYINHVLKFIDYLENEYDYNINDPYCFKDVKPSLINSYIFDMDVTNEYRKCVLFGISSFFKFLLNDEYIDSDPCEKVELPRESKEHKITSLTKEEIKIIENNILSGKGEVDIRIRDFISRDYAIVIMGLSLGLRVGSLTEINLEDIDFKNKEITITEKGNKTRTVMFGKKTEKIIKNWLKEREEILNKKGVKCDALFISKYMNRISTSAVRDIIKKYTYNVDKHITPHKLRSTCATNVYNSTGDIYLTADILGHRNIANTRRYAQVDSKRKKKAAEAMDDILF